MDRWIAQINFVLLYFIDSFIFNRGTALAQWLRSCATNRKVAGSIPAGVTGIFRWHKILRIPGVESASNRNEYQEYFLGGKGGRCVRLTALSPSCAVATKTGKLNFLEPSGPVQACNGTALRFYLSLICTMASKCTWVGTGPARQ